MKKLKILSLAALLITTMVTSCDKKPGSSDGSPSTPPQSEGPITPSGSQGGSSSEIPEEDLCINDGTLLSQISSMSPNAAYSGTVGIAGRRGNDLFVEDQSGGGFIYLNADTSYNSLSIGDKISVSGKIAEFATAGIKQIAPTQMTKVGSCRLKTPPTITKYNEIDNYRFSRVNISDMVISSKSITAGTAADSRVTVTLGSDSLELFISKRVAAKSEIENFFSALDAGAKISVVGGFADYYKKAQIALTDVSQLTSSDLSREDKVKAIENSLSPITSLKSTRRNLSLPTTGSYDSTIAWTSSNPSIISNAGVVTRPTDKDTEVTLSYVINVDGKAEEKKSFKITVLKIVEGESDYEYTYVEPSYSGTYYSGISEDLRDRDLLLELDGLLDRTHKDFTSYKNLFDVFKYTDADPNNPNNMISFYSGRSSPRSGMNREHVWPNSRGGSYVEDDPHMVRPTITSENSARGNDFFNVGSNWDPNSFGQNKYRGIAARIIFYCATIEQEHLKLVDLTNDSTGNNSMGKLSTLLEWNLEYDIDATEILRNDTLFNKYNTNRNPFIDDRNYACKIWGQTNSETKQVCGLKN